MVVQKVGDKEPQTVETCINRCYRVEQSERIVNYGGANGRNVCNDTFEQQNNHIDHRSYARQGKLEIPTIHEGADARKIDEKFQNGQVSD